MGPLAIAVVIGIAAGPVEANDASVELRWAAPTECPGRTDVEARIRELVGPGVQLRGVATAEVVRDGKRFEAEVSLQTDAGTTTRSFGGDSCAAVADAVALVIAVGLDPLAVSSVVREAVTAGSIVPLPDPSIPSPPAIAPPEATAPPTTPVRRTAPRREPPRLGVRGFVQGAGTVGVLPGVGGAVGGGLALTIDAARIELAGSHEIGRRFLHPESNEAGALIGASVGRLAACWTPSTGRFIFPLCAGAEVGAMTARGRGLSDRGTVRTVWATAVPHVRALWFPVRAVGFGPVLEIPVALVRPRFGVDDLEGDLLEAGSLGIRFGLAVEVVFGGAANSFDENRRTRR